MSFLLLLRNYIYRPSNDFFLVFNQAFELNGSKMKLVESTLVGKAHLFLESLIQKVYVLVVHNTVFSSSHAEIEKIKVTYVKEFDNRR